MKAPSRPLYDAILLLGLLALLVILSLGEAKGNLTYFDTLEVTSSVLKGRAEYPEIVQDFVGFRGLSLRANPYPVLGAAFGDLGLRWDVNHESTHPPTAFLFVAPFAFLPLNIATACWAWLMLLSLFSTFLCYGFPWKIAMGLTGLFLLWPPLALSLEQITIIWMWGIAVGFRLGRDRTFWAGVGIGIASLTKLLPALMIVVFAFRKQWTAILGFCTAWILAVVVLVELDPAWLSEYILVSRTNGGAMILRADNSSFLFSFYRFGGVPGVILAIVCLLCLFSSNRRFFHAPGVLATPNLWMLFSFLSVALLPIAWIYSVAPLLPVILFLLSKRKLSTTFAGLCALLIPCVVPPWGPITVVPLVASTGATGMGLIFDALPSKVFAAMSLKELTSAVTSR